MHSLHPPSAEENEQRSEEGRAAAPLQRFEPSLLAHVLELPLVVGEALPELQQLCGAGAGAPGSDGVRPAARARGGGGRSRRRAPFLRLSRLWNR